MTSGSYTAYLEVNRNNIDYDIDKGLYEGRENYKTISANKANGSNVLCIIMIANDTDKTITDTTFDAREVDAISEYIKQLFGKQTDEYVGMPYYQSVPKWLQGANDRDEYIIGEDCVIKFVQMYV